MPVPIFLVIFTAGVIHYKCHDSWYVIGTGTSFIIDLMHCSERNLDKHLKIMQVSTLDIGGGAEKVAWNLFQAYRLQGYKSWLAVGHKRSEDPYVFSIPNDKYRSRWAKVWLTGSQWLQPLVGKVRGVGRVQNLFRQIAEPFRWWKQIQGHEVFDFSGTWHLLELTPERPTIVHCHNLHGKYFDLRSLPWLSFQVPTILTLHDAWLLSGHCAHSFTCERWKIGCGHCPDLTIEPAIRRDKTAENWQLKQQIFAKSHLYVVTPSQWLMDKVKLSMLAPTIVEARVIPNGLDLSIFQVADRQFVRSLLGIPQDVKVLLFTANGIRQNSWKDYNTLRSVVAQVAERLDDQDVLFIALGEDAPAERVGRAEVHFVPYQKDPNMVARYYQAANVYIHAAKADTFPNTVLEALACGIPVVATAVGGIPEQIKEARTGFLVLPGDTEAMTEAIVRLLTDDQLHKFLGKNAAQDARQRFGMKRQVDDYIDWYHEISENWQLSSEIRIGGGKPCGLSNFD